MTPTLNPATLHAIDWAAITQEAAEILSRYVGIDSSHPRGRTVETAALFADHLAAEGIESKLYQSPEEGKVNLVARLKATDPVGKPLLLSNHMDVVQAVAADWRFDPYSGEIADGYVYGRGALDMKGMGVMELMTMLMLKRRSVDLVRDVILLCNCDEEIGSPMGAHWMIDEHFSDLDPEFVLDEGGSGMKGFFSAGDVFEISVGEKRAVRVKMVARAEPGHASQPWDEAATHRLVRAAHSVLTQPPEDRECPPGRRIRQAPRRRPVRQEIAAYRATKPLLHDTVSPDHAQRRLQDQRHSRAGRDELRLPPAARYRRARLHLQPRATHQRSRSASRGHVARCATATAAWDGPLFRAIEAACADFAPNAIVAPSICVGGTDARYFRERGVPAYGLVPCLFDAEDLKGYHGINERLSLANLRLGTQIVFDTTLRAAAL